MNRKTKSRLWVAVGVSAVASLCSLGVLAYFAWQWLMDRAEPENQPASSSSIVVLTCYRGMSASDIEKTITNRIERWVNQAAGIKRLTSKSLPGVSIVHAYFRDDIDPNAALTITSQLALGTAPMLPLDVSPPVVVPSLSQPVGVLVVHSAAATGEELKQTARIDVRSWLLCVEGCVAPVVVGGKDRMVRIRLDPQKLEVHHLSSRDVVEALRKESYDIAAEMEHEVILGDPFLDNLLLEEKRISAGDDNAVVLRDIGRMEDAPALQTALYRIDGCPAVGVPIYARNGARPRTVVEDITNKVEALELPLPPRFDYKWVPFGARGKHGRADNGLLTISVRSSSNCRLAEMEKGISHIEQLLEQNIPAKERNAILSEIGMTSGLSVQFTNNAGSIDATILVQLSGERSQSAAAYAAKLRRLLHEERDLADLSIRFSSRDMPAPVDIRITGGKRDEATRLAQQIRQRLLAIRGAVDVDIAQRPDAPYLLLAVNSEKTKEVGLNATDVVTQIATAFDPSRIWERNLRIDQRADNRISVAVPYHEDVKLDEILDMKAKGAAQARPVKLSSLATLQRTTEAVEIHHVDLSRVLDVRANIEERDRRDMIADVRKMIQELQLPAEMKVGLAE